MSNKHERTARVQEGRVADDPEFAGEYRRDQKAVRTWEPSRMRRIKEEAMEATKQHTDFASITESVVTMMEELERLQVRADHAIEIMSLLKSITEREQGILRDVKRLAKLAGAENQP